MKKNYTFKSSNQIVNDINMAYTTMINKTNSNIIKIDITNTKSKHIQDFNFKLRKLFNSLRKKYSINKLDYLYVIEIPESISMLKPIYMNKIKYHSHIVLNTDINEKDILREIKLNFIELNRYTIGPIVNGKFDNEDVYLENITLRNDLNNYSNYLTKQKNTLTNYSYNYFIN
jgi:hypothetical protein